MKYMNATEGPTTLKHRRQGEHLNNHQGLEQID